MKLKATASRVIPDCLKKALDDTEVAVFFRKLAILHLHISEAMFGPATHYVQETDFTIPDSESHLGVTFVLSQVSANRFRSAQDFADLLLALQKEYATIIARNTPKGTNVQLFGAIALDELIEGHDGRLTRLLEMKKAVWIEGESLEPWFDTRPLHRG